MKLQFHISLKNENVIEEVKSAEKPLTLSEAQASPYSQLLMGDLLITFNDMQNEKLMLKLANKVYTRYDAFVKKYSLDALERHLKYIRQHSQNIKDLVVYLDNALTDYQKRLANDSNRKKNKAGKSPVMKEKLPDWATDEKARKNVLTEKGIQDGKEIDELLAKINKDK